MDFSVQVDISSDIPVIRVKGEIDIYTCPKLNKALMDLISGGSHIMIIDLEETNYLDSTGLGTIAYAARSVQDKEGKIHLICSHKRIKKIFEASGLDRKNIQIFEKEEDAFVGLT